MPDYLLQDAEGNVYQAADVEAALEQGTLDMDELNAAIESGEIQIYGAPEAEPQMTPEEAADAAYMADVEALIENDPRIRNEAAFHQAVYHADGDLEAGAAAYLDSQRGQSGLDGAIERAVAQWKGGDR